MSEASGGGAASTYAEADSKDVKKSGGQTTDRAIKGKERSKGSQRKPTTPTQRKDLKTKDTQKSSGDQTVKDGAKVKDEKDVISWLNKKITKQDGVSAEAGSSPSGKNRPNSSSKQRISHSARNRSTSNKVENWRNREGEMEEGKSSSKRDFKVGKSDREKSGSKGERFRQQPGRMDTRKEMEQFHSARGKGRNQDLSYKTEIGKENDKQQMNDVHQQSKESVNDNHKDVVEIGSNVNVVNGKYVGGNRMEKRDMEYENPVQTRDNNTQSQNWQYTDVGSHPQVYVYGGLHVYNTPYVDHSPLYYNNEASGQQQHWYNYGDQQFPTWNQGNVQATKVTDQITDNKITEPKNEQKFESKGFSRKFKIPKSNLNVDANHSVQASVLTEQLLNESYECMVCCEKIRCHAPVWSCTNCYHVFHLRCVRKWAKSPAAVVEAENGGWRCPACQNINQSIPNMYRCFCGTSVDPVWNPREGITPHSCGELCKKKRESSGCPHLCNQLCHPGPCPTCPVMVTKACLCGKMTQQTRCGLAAVIQCKEVCQKLLNCDIHSCTRTCHPGTCDFCEVNTEQVCYCGNSTRQAHCGSGQINEIDGRTGYFSCDNICQRTLDCEHHKCERVCHKGRCYPCKLKPSLVTQCPCGKTTLQTLLGDTEQRQSCLDPIPTCNKICNKVLPCSTQSGVKSRSSSEHRCKQTCHHGNCGLCDGKSTIVCRCGAAKKEINCSDISTEVYLCDQRCNHKRQCGRHRCNQKCCTDKDHKCELICGKKLRCGTHICDEPCHRGYCPPCFMTSFEELTCHCGSSVMFPPIPCGTPPPECTKPCNRQHQCSHRVNHQCHSEEVCPPCTVLTKKMCSGNHQLRLNVPCHVTDVSCGKPCGSQLACGHQCIKLCHKPPCDSEPCTQPCRELRKECAHSCGASCHQGTPCPTASCKVKITITCKCGRRSDIVPCLQGGDKVALAQFYQRITTESLANKMKDVQQGQSVDISAVVMLDDKSTRYIECNDECAHSERARRMAEALGIDEHAEPFGSSRILYSPFLVNEAKSNLIFLKSIEEAFENLISIAQKLPSGQKSHSFPPMNPNQRRIIHELAVHYICSSVSYDAEPKRNTVITATKASRLPSVTLSSHVLRQINPPAPPPVPFLPSDSLAKSRLFKEVKEEKKSKTWAQVPDYFADDFDD